MSSFRLDFEVGTNVSKRIRTTPVRLRTQFVTAVVENAPELKQYITALSSIVLPRIISTGVGTIAALESLPMIADQDNAALSDLLDLVTAQDE